MSAHARAPFGAQLEDLLGQALDAAHSLDDPTERAALIEQVAHTALRHGAVKLARESLLDLPEPGVRALIHLRLAEQRMRSGDTQTATHHLDRALAEARGATRWSPRTGWLRRADALAEIAEFKAATGSVEEAEALATEVHDVPLASARAWIGVAEARRTQGDWEAAREAISRIRDPADRERVVGRLVRAHVRAGQPAEAFNVAQQVVQGAYGLGPWQRFLTVERTATALARTGARARAEQVWSLALELADALDPLDATRARCRVVESQARALGSASALDVMRETVDQLKDTVLPPSPQDEFPWRFITETIHKRADLGGPLRAILRTRRVLAPAWCFVLGELELAAGSTVRAKRAAGALQQAHAADPSDTEPAWLAALLLARTGQLDDALELMRSLLETLPPGSLISPPGEADGVPAEIAFSRALLQAGDVEAAVELARQAAAGELRAQALYDAARATLQAGDAEGAAALADEAALNLLAAWEVADPSPQALGTLTGDLVRMLAAFADSSQAGADARELFEYAVGRIEGLTPGLAIQLLVDLESRLHADPVRAQRLKDVCMRHIQASSHQAELLLTLADTAFTPYSP